MSIKPLVYFGWLSIAVIFIVLITRPTAEELNPCVSDAGKYLRPAMNFVIDEEKLEFGSAIHHKTIHGTSCTKESDGYYTYYHYAIEHRQVVYSVTVIEDFKGNTDFSIDDKTTTY